MLRNLVIGLALALIVGLPFALKPKNDLLAAADDSLVIITPHNEAIRFEFSRAFRDWYKTRTGRSVRIDWRVPGGTSEIARYLASGYQAPFEQFWKKTAHMSWDDVARRSFDDGRIALGPDPTKDSPVQAARRAFLDSDVGIGIDLFFGGGSFDFVQQGTAGRLVNSGFIATHPELFGEGPDQIPQKLGGETFWDRGGTWMGTVMSSFGICYNLDGVTRSGQAKPRGWDDLGAPQFFGQVALADPNMSGSVAKAFEMIIQQRIEGQRAASNRRDAAANPGAPEAPATGDDLRRGWDEAMRSILHMGANTRYFADAATKIPIDVGNGDAALGMSIDFYGRFQAESTRNPVTGQERMAYFNVPGGTSIGVDSIGMLRGAPHRKVALQFMEYAMSVEGQKLWNFKVGAPGGPVRYALRRLPIRPELYAPDLAGFRSDPTVYPYLDAKKFTYHPEWTGPLFNPIRFIVRVMCVDAHEEARDAMEALIAARAPAEAMKTFEDVSAVSFDQAGGRIKEALRSPDPLASVRLAKELGDGFRAQYRRAGELAREGR